MTQFWHPTGPGTGDAGTVNSQMRGEPGIPGLAARAGAT
jgi:hypothetical protein